MYKTLHGRLPRYLSGECQLISDVSRRLRSSDTFTFAFTFVYVLLFYGSINVRAELVWVTDH